MVLGTAPETEVRLLPPILPALLLQRRNSSAAYRFQPRAIDTSAVSGSSRDASASASTSGNSVPPAARSSEPNLSISLPRSFNFGAFGMGLGIGGASYLGGVNSSKAVALWPFFGRSRGHGANDKKRKRILIMMSNTGGGHRASAEAIKAAFQEKYGSEYEILIEDMWKDHTPAPFNKLPDTYAFLVHHSTLWWLSYVLLQPKWVHVPYLRAVGLFISKRLHQAFDKFQPDLVVSVHPLMQHVPIRVLRSRIRSGVMKPINFATVVTDFTTCHNTWFHTGVTRCFVPTEYCKMLASRNGLQDEQIVVHGLPIRPIFSKALPPKPRMKKVLGLEPHVPAVLLVGGGEGMGKLEETVDHIAEQLGDHCQVVVICGRNKKLLDKLRAKSYPSGMRVVACGFVDNLHEWMAGCDVIVTKAGPGTMAEALISGLPILLNGNVPGQEEGNIPYVIDNNVGTFETSPVKIAHILRRWLGPEKLEFEAMGVRSRSLGRPEAVYNMVRDLAALTDKPDFSFGTATAFKEAKALAKAAA
mmetsp:Transcript_13700/g.29410  ORF Transcript_13700/g.29410 Transcript_13700/m.29410 type:complete len:529 (-) Transcript_13700:874-2460(-)